MALVDFTEIPIPSQGSSGQDAFELFAREFLVKLGFVILDGPDRGADGGRDIIISEKRQGFIGSTDFKWLVSCKHKAHSGDAVKPNEELNISDRLRKFDCNGFMGIYSTIASSGLNDTLRALQEKDKYGVMIFDREGIERHLLENGNLIDVLHRFFPKSYAKVDLKGPSNFLEQYSPLPCQVCGKDLLHRDIIDGYNGIIIFVQDMEFAKVNQGKRKYVDVYCVCKGNCDKLMSQKLDPRYITTWNDISDLIIPIEFLKLIFACMNNIRSEKEIYTDDAYEKLKSIIIALAQFALKRQTDQDAQRSKELESLLLFQ